LGKIDAILPRIFIKLDMLEFDSNLRHRAATPCGLRVGAAGMVTATVRSGRAAAFGNRNFTMPGKWARRRCPNSARAPQPRPVAPAL
jgi:hypothetical protein